MRKNCVFGNVRAFASNDENRPDCRRRHAGFQPEQEGNNISRRVFGGHDTGRADEDHAEPNRQRQPIFEERFHPEVRCLKSEISTETPNIQHRTLNVQWQKEIRHRSSELRIGRWTMDIGRLPRPCCGTKSLLPSPSNRFSSSECGAGGASNPNFTKSFRRRSVSVNRGKLSIVPKHKASWPSARCAEELCTNCGRKSDRKSLGTFPKLHGFRCSSKFSMRRRSCRFRCIRLKMLPANWEASRRASFGT